MLENYFKIAWRNLVRNKSYAVLNVLGLSIGLACCIIITLYVLNELSYDKFHDNYDELYRVVETMEVEGKQETYATTFSALAPSLKNSFPEIEHITHLYPVSGLVTGPNNIKFQEDRIILADTSFLEMFSFRLLSGDQGTALDKPFSMVITKATATKFFGNENPVGKSLSFKDAREKFDFEITGVIESPPSNSHISFDYILSYESLKTLRAWEYNTKYYPPMYTYAQIPSQNIVDKISSYIPQFADQYYGEDNSSANSFSFQPLADIHLRSNLQNELSTNFDISYIYIFLAISGFILIIACINFMNLATASSMKRIKEVGMRKTLGAEKSQLVRQFLSEAILMSTLSLVIAVFIVEAVIPYFNAISGKVIEFALFNSWEPILILTVLILVVGTISGSYPAFYLSSFRPIQSLKGDKAGQSFSSTFFRRGLVVFQFFISTGLIFGTVIVTQQLDFLKNSKLGFDKEKVLMIQMRETSDQINASALKQKLLTIPGVESVSAASGVPGIASGIHGFTVIPESNKADSAILQTLTVDFGYLKTLGIDVPEGRNFSEEYGTDETSAFIINKTAANKFNWDNPLGEELTLKYWLSDEVSKKGQVIGVVDDFQYNSLHKSIDPVIIHVLKGTYYHDYLALKLSTNDLQSVISDLESKWAAFNPERPMEYAFLDDTFDALYRSETRLSNIFNIFAILAVFIACLGLFGLASYSTEQRFKEIGIRKVLGAKVTDIVRLLGKEFTVLILIALCIGFPVAYLATTEWLNSFAERIDVSIWLFLISSLIVLLVAWITISFQTIKAALMDPVKSLKSE
ncbi:MAG: FtsX-like permease family protein [Balneola sp.]